MGSLKTIFAILKAIPNIAQLVNRAVSAFEAIRDFFIAAKKKLEMSKADDKAQKTKDTSDLEKMFGNGGQP